MVTGITVTTMADTRITIPTKAHRAFFAGAALFLLGAAVLHLFLGVTPVADGNQDMERLLSQKNLTGQNRSERLAFLLKAQGDLLAQEPADPFAWTRLSYLRLVSEGDRKAAFEALRMANTVSPREPRLMLERAIMWKRYADLHTAEDHSEQVRLWREAVRFQRKDAAVYALQYHMADELTAAVADDALLRQQWQYALWLAREQLQ